MTLLQMFILSLPIEKRMTVGILVFSLLPVFALALFGPLRVTGELDSSIAITCHYKTTSVNVHGRKFWCKWSRTSSGCDTIRSTTPFVAASYRNRTSISDFPKNGTFRVTIRQLQWKDAGQYRCGIGQNNNGFFFPVNLSISEDPSKAGQPELLFGERWGSITVRCGLQENITNTKKVWCKMGKTGCRTVADSDGYVDTNHKGRIVITEDRDSRIFKVLINHLMEEDTGWYRCGMETSAGKITLKDINLYVLEDTFLSRRPRLIQAVLGGSVSVNCYQDLQGNFNLTYWCKWKDGACNLLIDSSGYVNSTFAERISMVPHNQEIGVYTVRMKQLREADAGWFWCGATDGLQEHTFSMRLNILKARTSTLSSNVSKRSKSSPDPRVGSTGITWVPSWQYDRSTRIVSSLFGSTLPAAVTQPTPRSWSLSISHDSVKHTGSLGHGSSPCVTTSETSQSVPLSTHSPPKSGNAPQSAVPRTDSRGHFGSSDHKITTAGINSETAQPGSDPLDSVTVGPAVRHTDTRGHTQPPSLWNSKNLVTVKTEQGESPAERTLRSGSGLLSILVPVLTLALLLAVGLLLLVKRKLRKQRAQRPTESPGTNIAMDEVKSLWEETREASSDCKEMQESRQLTAPEDSESR